jgi:hypothetical protein
MISSITLAQEFSVEDFILKKLKESQGYSDDPLNYNGRNLSIVHQHGAFNDFTVTQNSTGPFYLMNRSIGLQIGFANTSSLDQNGSFINSYLMQYGSLNYAELDLTGEDIRTAVLQLGESNYLKQQIVGSHISYSIIQRGRDNQIISLDNNSGLKGIEIYQNGIGAKLFISTDYLLSSPRTYLIN